MKKAKKKTISRPSGSVANGSFARVTGGTRTGKLNDSGWIYCRDSFHSETTLNQMLIWHQPEAQSVGEFINKFEKALHHENLTAFGPTNMDRATWIKPAKFWTKTMVRRSLFTILLRAGMGYNKDTDNFMEALFAQPYARGSRRAVERFMSGYTWFKNNSSNPYTGWYGLFNNATDAVAKDLLTKKPIADKALLKFALAKLNLTADKLREEFRKTEYPLRKKAKPKKVVETAVTETKVTVRKRRKAA